MKNIALIALLVIIIPWLGNCKKSGSGKSKKVMVTTMAGTGEMGYFGGEVTTIAGGSAYGFADGKGTVALFSNPYGLAIDGAGYIYVADGPNHRIRKISFQ